MASSVENFDQVFTDAKEFRNFDKVYLALYVHPDWLTLIPRGRKWSILHQLVFAGNVNFLMQVLALQKANRYFNPLTKTVDGETILDIAQYRSDVPEMKEYIKTLMKIDEMLTHAKECRWQQCMNIVKENPDYLNEKTPYRRYYVIHHIACAGDIKIFEDFEKIPNCKFTWYLKAGGQTVSQVARDHGHEHFAKFIEQKYPKLKDEDEETSVAAENRRLDRGNKKENISHIMVQHNFVSQLDDEIDGQPSIPASRADAERMRRESKALDQLREADQERRKQEPAAVATNTTRTTPQDLLEFLICPLTHELFTDPVVAADGVTYERWAIENYMKNNKRSPTTNVPFANETLTPNLAIKTILNKLHPLLK